MAVFRDEQRNEKRNDFRELRFRSLEAVVPIIEREGTVMRNWLMWEEIMSSIWDI